MYLNTICKTQQLQYLMKVDIIAVLHGQEIIIVLIVIFMFHL